MARKCVVCGKLLQNDEEMIPYKGRYAHSSCFNNAIKLIKKDKDEKLAETEAKKKVSKARPKAELKDGLSNEEYKDKQKYYDFVKTLMGTDKLPAKVYALSDRYTKDYNLSWGDMYSTLTYLKEIKMKELTGDVVGIIPFYCDEAKSYYKEVERVEESNKNVDVNKLYSTRVIQIKPSKRKIKQIAFDSEEST